MIGHFESTWQEYTRRIADGDERALEAFIEESQALVFRTALRIVSQPSDAEEVTADIFARVWMAAGAYDPRRGSVGAWLVTMARSRAISVLRARAVRVRTLGSLRYAELSAGDGERWLYAAEARLRLRRALRGLSAEQRRAVELFYLSERPLREIADETAVPIGTVKTRLRLGLKNLRRLWGSKEYSPEPFRTSCV